MEKIIKMFTIVLLALNATGLLAQTGFPPENSWNQRYRFSLSCDSVTFYDRNFGEWVQKSGKRIVLNETGLLSEYKLNDKQGYKYIYNDNNQLIQVQFYSNTKGNISGNHVWAYTYEGDKVITETYNYYYYDYTYLYSYDGDNLVKIVRIDKMPNAPEDTPSQIPALNVSYIYENDVLVEKIDSVWKKEPGNWEFESRQNYSYINNHLASITGGDWITLLYHNNGLLDSIRTDTKFTSYSYDDQGIAKEELTVFQGSNYIDTSKAVCENYPIVTSVIDIDNRNNITAYPNPASSEVHFNMDYTEIANISVYDLNGRTQLSLVPNSNTLDISTLETGLYTIRILTRNGDNLMKQLQVVK